MKENTFKRSSRLALFAAVFAMLLALAMLMPMKAYAAETSGNYKGLDWKVVEKTDGSLELQLGNSTMGQTYDRSDDDILWESKPDAWLVIVREGDQQGVKEELKVRSEIPWLAYEDEITSVEIVGNIKVKGTMAFMFSGFENCTSIKGLDKIDTSKATSMNHLFAYYYYDSEGNKLGKYCPKITSLDVSSWDTSNVTYMANMFAGLSGLTSLDVSNFDTSNVWSMGNMFGKCSSLKTLDVSGFDTSNVRSMGNMFNSCSSLTSLDVSNFDTGKAEDMYFMFYGCSSLQALDVSKFDTKNVYDMKGAFVNCSGLKELDVSGWDTSNNESLANMFMGCEGLTSLDLSGWDTSKVESLSYAFRGCTNLEEIKGLGDWNTSNVTNMTAAFSRCPNLKTIDMLLFNTDKLKDAGWFMLYDTAIVSEIEAMSDSDQYSAETQKKLADAMKSIKALTEAEGTAAEVKAALTSAAKALRDAAVEDARRALDAANDPEVVEKANNSSAATKKAYDDAKANLENLLADSNANAAQINAAVKALDDAVKDLTPKSDEEKAYDKAQKATEDALKDAKDAKTAADGVAASKPGSDEAVKAAEEATAKAETAVTKANEAVTAAEKTGDQAKIDAAKALKAEADKALAEALKLEADQKIKRGEANPSEANKKAAQDAANKA
ncbi:MAG: BspA family leucine-rich repeat surface protein, partial [Mogibacterium sp.]|nr:BspA family leucine-rich repeat surface protein [Mogibacterium sp.]